MEKQNQKIQNSKKIKLRTEIKMSDENREFIDEDRKVMNEYYELCEKQDDWSVGYMKGRLSELIEKDPDFLDP